MNTLDENKLITFQPQSEDVFETGVFSRCNPIGIKLYQPGIFIDKSLSKGVFEDGHVVEKFVGFINHSGQSEASW